MRYVGVGKSVKLKKEKRKGGKEEKEEWEWRSFFYQSESFFTPIFQTPTSNQLREPLSYMLSI
jgi:hypothetical protein